MPDWTRNIAKRAIDLLAALVGLLILAVLYPWIAWRIRRDSPGPIFYRASRLGRQGKIFGMLKFRTMYERQESYAGPHVTAADDPRITPFGRYLRNSKLNELPQFWNVLVGEMSLVGPRPEDPQIAAAWPEGVRQELLSIRPGVTSPATVLYIDEEALLHTQEVDKTYLENILPGKQRLDQLYVRHHSFWSDFDILIWTFLVLLPRLRHHKPPERQLFVGPISRLARNYLSWFGLDLVIALAAIGLVGVTWRVFGPVNIGWRAALVIATGFAMLYSLIGGLLGLNRIAWSRARPSDALGIGLAAALATGAALTVNASLPVRAWWPGAGDIFIKDRPMAPSALILVSACLALAGFVAVRYRQALAVRWLGRRKIAQERVLVVGGGETGQFAAWMLTHGPYASSFRIIGFADDDLFKQGLRIHGVNVIGQRADIPLLIEKYDIGLVIFAIHNISDAERQRLLDICASTPARSSPSAR